MVVSGERAMHEQFRQLACDADLSNVGLQILPVDRPHIGCGELSAFFCFEPSPGPGWSKELILTTTESRWPSGQREP
jgi:hypothetical protein